MDILEIALNTVEEMMEDRNYIPILSSIPETDIKQRMSNRKYITLNGKYALVAIVESTSAIKNYSEYIENPDYENIFFVYLNNLNISHYSIEKNLDYKVEIWSVYDLLINVSKHYFQPKISKVEEEIDFNGKIPKISFYDPLIRYFRFKKKDIIKIVKHNGIINYRTVV